MLDYISRASNQRKMKNEMKWNIETEKEKKKNETKSKLISLIWSTKPSAYWNALYGVADKVKNRRKKNLAN